MQGERVALIGASGSGKTTLLRIINGWIPFDQGNLALFGNLVRPGDFRRRKLRRRIGFIFQAFHLVDRATVYENIMWGRLGWRGNITSLVFGFDHQDHLRVNQAIRDVNLEPHAFQRVSSLSGGQQQRVGIARTLVQEPDLILADEPVSNLDPGTAAEIMALLESTCRQRNVTLIMALHQPELANLHANRIVELESGLVVKDVENRTRPNSYRELQGTTETFSRKKIQS
jgi:phosphonate transport system ATP-binding protein